MPEGSSWQVAEPGLIQASPTPMLFAIRPGGLNATELLGPPPAPHTPCRGWAAGLPGSWQRVNVGGLSLSCGGWKRSPGALPFPQGPGAWPELLRALGAGRPGCRSRKGPRERREGSGRLKGHAGLGESMHPDSSPVILGVSLCPQLCTHLLPPGPGASGVTGQVSHPSTERVLLAGGRQTGLQDLGCAAGDARDPGPPQTRPRVHENKGPSARVLTH